MATQAIQVVRASDLGANLRVTPEGQVQARTIVKQVNASGQAAFVDSSNELMPIEKWQSFTYRARLNAALDKLQLADVIVSPGGGDNGWNRLTIKAGTTLATIVEVLPSTPYNFNAMDGFDGGEAYNTQLGFAHVIEPARVGASFTRATSEFPYLKFQIYDHLGIPRDPGASDYPVTRMYVGSLLGYIDAQGSALSYSLGEDGVFFHYNDQGPKSLIVPQDKHIDQPPGNGGGNPLNFADWNNPTQSELDAAMATQGLGLLDNFFALSGTGAAGDPFIFQTDIMAQVVVVLASTTVPPLSI